MPSPRSGPLLAETDNSVEGGNKLKGGHNRSVGSDHIASCYINKSTCAGNECVRALYRNAGGWIESTAGLKYAVYFISICAHHLELARNSNG
jgi:hypothetical protein